MTLTWGRKEKREFSQKGPGHILRSGKGSLRRAVTAIQALSTGPQTTLSAWSPNNLVAPPPFLLVQCPLQEDSPPSPKAERASDFEQKEPCSHRNLPPESSETWSKTLTFSEPKFMYLLKGASFY